MNKENAQRIVVDPRLKIKDTINQLLEILAILSDAPLARKKLAERMDLSIQRTARYVSTLEQLGYKFDKRGKKYCLIENDENGIETLCKYLSSDEKKILRQFSDDIVKSQTYSKEIKQPFVKILYQLNKEKS